ncbi:similar to Saccharomyces cerevisiae YMR077C VPS20 Myristoylated subunit of ESCRTIII [Maudiozyma saulgeensis]|uniref:Similar to Saccharomyces cerevisiae YMR077C VPS20 Myristoylated subunit of ESCRTIII n=1 Tax=Maudiozyma saulgeensis TaxID=1789683 RepID=A0A1X7QZR1_9SACH|nr:similar to Saccharomyces cerevisiae YMR077C VPS20 Myristoylated subunit of ESCRTIII [Kazachstania saulgeensis]
MGQKGSKIKITEQDRAVLQLKQSKDSIHKYTKRTSDLISHEKQELKILIQNNPQKYKENKKTRFILKRIHYQEHLLDQASDQLINLENMLSNIEFKLVEKQFFEGLQNGNKILTKLNKEFTNVDEVLDDVQEQIAYQDEINEALAQHVSGVNDYEDEIDKELEAMEKELLPHEELESNPVPNMPSVEKLPELNNSKPKIEDTTPVKKPIDEEQQRQEPALLA